MIFNVDQIKTNFNMVWMAEHNDAPICTAISPFEKGRLSVTLDYSDNSNYEICYDPSDTSTGTSIYDRLSFKLYHDGQLVGVMRGENQKVKGLFQSYSYRKLVVDNVCYYLYEVGFGNKGLYLCIYKEDQLICIVDKNLTVVNYKDKYTAYALSGEYLPFIMPLVIYYDITAHGDIAEISMLSVKKKVVNTIQKELIKKYDPDFISKIKALN